MKELIEQIEMSIVEFKKDALAQAQSGNKSAGARARKSSLELERMMKSLAESKK